MLVVLLTVPHDLHATGEKVVLFLQNRSVVIGELLCVRDSELVLATKVGCSDEELGSDTNLWVSVLTRDIREIKVKGRSYVMTGVALGAGAGLAIGAVIALAQPRPENSFASFAYNQEALGIILGSVACGLFIGGTFGEVASFGDKIIVPERREDFAKLNELARFPKKSRGS